MMLFKEEEGLCRRHGRTLVSRCSVVALAVLLWTPPCEAQSDRRSIEHLRLDCASELGRREVTLFGNGTIRLREGLIGKEEMWLEELVADEVRAYLARLAEDTRDETEPRYETIEGPWIERCVLYLDLPGSEQERFEFGRYDSLSLDLHRAVAIARELGERVDQSRPPAGTPSLPRDYRPKVGDVLRRADGKRFLVVGFTWDGTGVEVAGIEDPITLYLSRQEARNMFISVERRSDRP